MKQSALSARQGVLLLSMWAGFPVTPEDGDIMRLSACGYISPEGPQGKWEVNKAGEKRVLEMTGQHEVFDPQATQAVIDFLKKADLQAWAKNLPIIGDAPNDIRKLREAIGVYVLQGSKISLKSWGPNPDDDDLCALLCYSLADVARSHLVDWSAVYELFREVEIHG